MLFYDKHMHPNGRAVGNWLLLRNNGLVETEFVYVIVFLRLAQRYYFDVILIDDVLFCISYIYVLDAICVSETNLVLKFLKFQDTVSFTPFG